MMVALRNTSNASLQTCRGFNVIETERVPRESMEPKTGSTLKSSGLVVRTYQTNMRIAIVGKAERYMLLDLKHLDSIGGCIAQDQHGGKALAVCLY